jgi:signal transduction histidine kinase
MRISQPPKAFEHGSTALQGTGIGLPLAKRLVESMGGVIGAESNMGTGKIFSFDLKRWLMPSRGKKYDV